MGRVIGGFGIVVIAIAMAIAGAVSVYTPLLVSCSLSDRHALALSFFDGRVRLFYFHSEVEPIRVVKILPQFPPGYKPKLPILGEPLAPYIRVERLPLPEAIPPGSGAGFLWWQRQRPYDIRLGSRQSVPDFGGKWKEKMSYAFYAIPFRPPAGEFSYFRLPVWLPVSLMILFPIRLMIAGPWRQRRRRKKNQCVSCGYSLHGLTEARCPECGTTYGGSKTGHATGV